MKIHPLVVAFASTAVTTVAMTFLQDTIATMIPWLLVMFAVIVCDLVSGIRKSMKLNVPVSVTTAFRATMGKLVTYFAFVLMVAMIDVASGGEYGIAKFSCLGVCILEMGSVFSNILKPYGINLSPKGFIKLLLAKATDSSMDEMDEVVKKDNIRKAKVDEDKKWNRNKHKLQ